MGRVVAATAGVALCTLLLGLGYGRTRWCASWATEEVQQRCVKSTFERFAEFRQENRVRAICRVEVSEAICSGVTASDVPVKFACDVNGCEYISW